MLRVALFTERGRMLRILLGLEIIHSLCFSLRMLLFWRPLRRAWRVADLKVPINHYIIHYVQWTNVRNGNECTQRTNVRNGQMYAMDKCTQRINVRNGRMYATDKCTQRTNVRNGRMCATDMCAMDKCTQWVATYFYFISMLHSGVASIQDSGKRDSTYALNYD